MIVFLQGEIVYKSSDTLHLAVEGVGYGLLMSSRSLSSIGTIGDEVFVYTHLQPRENELNLYGFSTIEERELFFLLNSVTGVGPKVALSALSTLSVPALQQAISSEDIATISTAPGLGKKTASRIVLELKEKFTFTASEESEVISNETLVSSDALEETRAALGSMGFSLAEIDSALAKIDSADELKTEELILKTLQLLSR